MKVIIDDNTITIDKETLPISPEAVFVLVKKVAEAVDVQIELLPKE